MIDKVQKIKDWIGCQQDSLMDANGNFQHSEDEAVYDTLCNLDAYIDFLQEKHVSEELGKVADQYSQGIESDYTNDMFDRGDIYEAVRYGAQWQKEQDQSTIELAEDHAMFAGMKKMKEQMMKDAVDGVVHRFDDDGLAAIHYNDPKGVPMCYYASASGLEAGDKVKLMLAKED